jgi:hypothetical protein
VCRLKEGYAVEPTQVLVRTGALSEINQVGAALDEDVL